MSMTKSLAPIKVIPGAMRYLTGHSDDPPTMRGGGAASRTKPATAPPMPSVSVVIPAFTVDRWRLLERAVTSAQRQTHPPTEVLVCIDRNPDLFERCRHRWPPDAVEVPPVRVLPATDDDGNTAAADVHRRAHGSYRRFGAGWARNAAAAAACGDIIAFLDDDAEAAPDWLEHLVAPYRNPTVLAVGGPPLPRYETARPPWFPGGFDWVFGCAYAGLPADPAPLRHLIGANMSVRHSAFKQLGGFRSIDFDDLDMCMRLEHLLPRSVWYQPSAVVHHYVPANRVAWRYFYQRCYFVNREKVLTFKAMGRAANLAAERAFVVKLLASGLVREMRTSGPARWRVVRLAAALVGIAAAAAGHLAGRIRYLCHPPYAQRLDRDGARCAMD